jgi:hypothetical protein
MSQQPIYQPSTPNHSLIYMLANELPKQDGAKSIVPSKIYQVVNCIEIRYSVGEVWWHIWHLLQCPVVGINSLIEAHRRAKEWKAQHFIKFQQVIIGETDGDFESIDLASIFVISAIGGFDAGEVEFPDFLLKESGFL